MGGVGIGREGLGGETWGVTWCELNLDWPKEEREMDMKGKEEPRRKKKDEKGRIGERRRIT